MTDIKTNPFPIVTIATPHGPLALPGEPVNEYLAITPTTAFEDDGTPRLGGGFVLTHIPTGYTLTPYMSCIECCRAAGRRLAAVEVDWAQLDAPRGILDLPENTQRAIITALAPARYCEAELCTHPEAT